MNHETVQALIPAYAIQATDAEETALVEAHLFTCAQCRRVLAQYRQLNDDLLYTIPPRQAPPRIMFRLRATLRPPVSGRVPRYSSPFWAVGAVILLLAAMLIRESVVLRRAEDQVRAQATALALSTEGKVLPVLGTRSDISGALYVREDAHVAVLQVSHVPPPPSGHVYQIWLIRGGNRQSGGLFRPDANGQAMVIIRTPEPIGTYQAIGVTVEPDGGSPAPTTPRVFGVPLKGGET